MSEQELAALTTKRVEAQIGQMVVAIIRLQVEKEAAEQALEAGRQKKRTSRRQAAH